MGRSTKGSGKNRDLKRKRREQRKRRQKAEQAQTGSWKARMQRAGRWPLLECRIGSNFRESSLAQVLVAREGPGRIAVGFFLVDMGCLGVKDCLHMDDLDQSEYDDVLERLSEHETFERCDPAFAVKVVESGARYAAELGFRPHPDFSAAREIIGDIDPDLCRDEVELGRGGKPLYIEGPDDDASEVLRRLEERVGPDGFHYVCAEGSFPADFAQPDFPGEDDPDPERRSWGRLRRTEGRMVGEVLEYAAAHRGKRFLEQAYEQYDPDGVGRAHLDEESDDGAFLPWALFNWIPRPKRRNLLGRRGEPRPLALEFLEANDSRLDPFERRFLETICNRPFSFYVVESVDAGSSLDLRDLLSGCTYHVHELQASGVLEVGSLIYARVLPMDSVAILVGLAPLCIPPLFRIRLIDMREEIAGEGGLLSEESLLAYDVPLRDAYWRIAEQLYDPPAPVLQNTDGEPLVFCRVVFDLHCTPEQAVSKLKPLTSVWTDEDFREQAVFGADGEMESIEFPWTVSGNKAHASWDNTVLGQLEIEGGELTADVNSEARAGRIRREVERRLGDEAVWRVTEREAPEKLFAESRRPKASAKPNERRTAMDAIEADPAAQQQLEQMAAAHWESWIDSPIPALGGKSPRDASRTAAGRERLDALLCDMTFRESAENVLKPDIESLRRELGLLVDV